MVAYARKSAMSKYFSASKERRKAEAKRGAVTSALQALNLQPATCNPKPAT